MAEDFSPFPEARHPSYWEAPTPAGMALMRGEDYPQVHEDVLGKKALKISHAWAIQLAELDPSEWTVDYAYDAGEDGIQIVFRPLT